MTQMRDILTHINEADIDPFVPADPDDVEARKEAARSTTRPVTQDEVVGLIMDYEGGDIDEEDAIALFQHLVNTGLAWQLQGHYGRTAQALLDQGIITRPNESVNEADDPFVPADSDEVEQRKKQVRDSAMKAKAARVKKAKDALARFRASGKSGKLEFSAVEGHCPICGSSEIYYGESQDDEGGRVYDIECDLCGTRSHEVHSMVYDYTSVYELPDLPDEEEDYVREATTDPFVPADPDVVQQRKDAEVERFEKKRREQRKKSGEKLRAFIKDNPNFSEDSFDNSENECPVCDSTNIEWIQSDNDGEFITWDCECEDCGVYFQQNYESIYQGTYMSDEGLENGKERMEQYSRETE